MTIRERKWGSWFFISLGVAVLFISLYGAATASPPPATKSHFRAALSEALVTMLGAEGGHIVFHLIFAGVALVVIWLGIKVRGKGNV